MIIRYTHKQDQINKAYDWAQKTNWKYPNGQNRIPNIAAGKLAEEACYAILKSQGYDVKEVTYPLHRDSGYDLGPPFSVKTAVKSKYPVSWAMYPNQDGLVSLCVSIISPHITRFLGMVEIKDYIHLLKIPNSTTMAAGKMVLYRSDVGI